MIEHESDPNRGIESQRNEPVTPVDKPIPTNWVTRADLTRCRPDLDHKIRRLDASEVEEIASKVGDALLETYWLTMGIVLDDYLKGDSHTEINEK